MKSIAQIAMDFFSAADEPKDTKEPAKAPEGGNPAGIAEETLAGSGGPSAGFRIKALKDPKNTGEEELAKQALDTDAPVSLVSFEEEDRPSLITEEEAENTESVSGREEISETPVQTGGEMVVFVEEPVTETADQGGKQSKSTRGRKSLKQTAAEADLIEIPPDEELFKKQYYTMGEVAAMFRVNQSLLRFWEAEFAILQPRKNKKGDRYFRPVDVKNLHLIYHLLRQRKYTIEGAREFLKNGKKAELRFEAIQRMLDIKAFLLELKAQL